MILAFKPLDIPEEIQVMKEGESRENRPQQPEGLEVEIGQATKGSRWIPWHTEAMKDVVTCDKSRGAGNTL